MRLTTNWLSCAVLLCAFASFADPPKVVKSFPAAGEKDVDPAAVTELRIVFDQPMSPKGWSVVRSGQGVFPDLVDKPKWEDDNRTFVWRMKLEPNTDYWLSVNGSGGRFTNFRAADGTPAEHYPIPFSTGPAKDAPPPAPDVVKANQEAIARLRRAVDEDYAYRDLRKVDWDKQFKEFTPRLESARGPGEFASIAAKMLAPAQDLHLALRVGDRRIPTARRDGIFPAVDGAILRRTVPQWRQRADFVYSGQFPDGTRYLCLASLPASTDDKFLKAAYDVIKEAADADRPLILDLRGNGGGDEPAARKIAGCFLDHPAVYAAHTIRSGGKTSVRQDRVVQPNPEGPKFRGKLLVLTGPATVSSCESFVLMLKQVPGCTTIGTKTAGSSGNPKLLDLGNGVTAAVPQWQALRPDGTCFEGEGLTPDVELNVEPKDFKDVDPILAEALKRAAAAKAN